MVKVGSIQLSEVSSDERSTPGAVSAHKGLLNDNSTALARAMSCIVSQDEETRWVEAHYGHHAWQTEVVHFLHSVNVQIVSMSLLVLDILIIIAESRTIHLHSLSTITSTRPIRIIMNTHQIIIISIIIMQMESHHHLLHTAILILIMSWGHRLTYNNPSTFTARNENLLKKSHHHRGQIT